MRKALVENLIRGSMQTTMSNRPHHRIRDDKFVYDPEMPPELNLAAAIVRRAISDARLLRIGRKPTKEECFHYNEQELAQFFKSKWCATLLGVADIKIEKLLKEVEK